jgi:hypothetical protein
MEWADPLIISSASKTIGECATSTGCADGCCRYHKEFLTCDTSNLDSDQPCVCNQWTDTSVKKAHIPSTGFGTHDRGGVNVGGGTFSISTEPSEATNNRGAACADGSAWQLEDLGFINCSTATDCEGVNRHGTQTCCKRAFCWCGSFDVEHVECV